MIYFTYRMEYWGPCKESPVIISPPSDTYGPKGKNLCTFLTDKLVFFTFYLHSNYQWYPKINMVKK